MTLTLKLPAPTDQESGEQREKRLQAAIALYDARLISQGSAAAFLRGALLLQEKWVLMIVFSLRAGPVGFSELMRRGGINTTTLTQRLHLLEQEGLLAKTIHSAMPPRTSYELTEAGRALGPVFDAITEWSGIYLPALPEANACPAEQANLEGKAVQC